MNKVFILVYWNILYPSNSRIVICENITEVINILEQLTPKENFNYSLYHGREI